MIVAKFRISWMFAGGLHRVILMYLLLVWLLIFEEEGLTVTAQGPDPGTLYLDQKELAVKWIAGNATLNNGNCGSLDNCKAACSRVTCHPLSGESRQCTSVDFNEHHDLCPCVADESKMLIDYSRSFVTLPAPASTTLQTEVARDICLQRKLDSTFKNVSFSSNYNFVYFGSTSGAFRSFPGREKDESQCTSYDPRNRFWYLNGISVFKDVKILVDVANSMGNAVTGQYNHSPGTTYLDVAKNITLTLLDTIYIEDIVEVFSFDSTNATSLGGAFHVYSSYNDFNPRPELTALMTDVTSLAASYATGTPSDLNGAIRRAADSFNQTRSLKVIVVLSNGLFVVNSTTFPSAALKKNQAKLMVYNLPSNDDGGDTFLLKTPFQKDICSVQGSFELLNAVATANPLYSMRSYFNYLARIQLSAVGGKVTWSNTYASVSQSLYRLSATYPAFGSDGLLIGVAGTDVVLDSLDEPLRTLVLRAVSSRVRGTMQATANISMTCSYQINTPANSSCPGSTLPDSSAICPRNDFTSSLADRTCCGTCGSGENSGLKAGIIAGILIAGLAASFILIVVAGICYKVRAGNRWKPRSFLPWWEPISFLPVEVDFLNLCELVVHSIKILVNSGTLLNGRQCLDLSSKLSKTTQNVREIVFHCRASAVLFKPALEKLYRDLQKAYFLVNDCSCREEDWCRASVFQIQNEISFRVILLDVGLCYNEIYEQARSTTSEEMNFPEDLRNSSVFMPSPQNVVREDQLDLQKGLGSRASGRSGSLEECLAKYLVAKLNHTYDPSKTNAFSTCNSILWSDESGPSEIWGNSHFLGAGSGASGVCSTKWMGIPCAKKEFHLKESEPFFLNEASILAHLKHPCIVNFICCGNGEQKGDRFIAMELMERNLCDLIEDQRGVYFSLFAVVDIMIQIARGMCYLHSQGIAHRDLKPQNVVVNTLTSPQLVDHFCVKLVDFGMSKTKVQVSKSNTISIPGVGTTNYRAPEIHPKAQLDGIGKVGWFKADVFSFAMTCAHVLSLKKPFGDTQLSKVYQKLINGSRPELPGGCPQELETLLEDCWNAAPGSRPPFLQIWTRLEVFRYKILRGYPDSDLSLQHGSDNEFFKLKIKEHFRTSNQRLFDAASAIEDNEDNILADLPV